MIDWSDTNESWGNPETCVHHASDGSWVGDGRHDDLVVQP